jgi:predicted GH43/DUF377 family glycosyl hydrolase
VAEVELDLADPRVVRRKADNLLRLTSISHLRLFRSPDGGSMNWVPGPILLPESPMEEFGIEDPRITEVDGVYRITYVAMSRYGAATALASTNDFVTFERHGAIFCLENKDVVLFSHEVAGQYGSITSTALYDLKRATARPDIGLRVLFRSRNSQIPRVELDFHVGSLNKPYGVYV